MSRELTLAAGDPVTRRFWVALGSITFLAILLRLWGATHGLDLADERLSVWHSQNDEETQAAAVRDRHLAGEFDPGPCWLWGSGGFQVYGILDRIVLPFLFAIHGVPEEQRAAKLAANLSWVLLSHRILASLAAGLGVALLGLALRRVHSERVGLLGAWFLATAYLAVRESHYGTFDQWILLGTVVAFRSAILLADRPALTPLLLASSACGFFASFKYSGLALIGIVWLGFLQRSISFPPRLVGADDRRNLAWWRVLLALALSIIVAAGTYLAMSPTFFRSFDAVVSGIRSQQGLIGFSVAKLPEMVRYHLSESIFVGAGESMTLAALVGVVVHFLRPAGAASRGSFAIAFVAACVLPFSNTSHSVRQALPLVPFVAAFAACAVELVVRRTRGPWSTVVLAIVIAAPSVVRSVSLDLLLSRTDTRQEGLSFLVRQRVEPESAIGIGFYGLPRTSLTLRRPPFMDWLDAVHRRQAVSRSAAGELRPRWIVRDLMSGVDESLGWTDFAAQVRSEYELAFAIDGRKDGASLELPDLTHGTPFHFIPYASPWQMHQPGPAFEIYRRLETK